MAIACWPVNNTNTWENMMTHFTIAPIGKAPQLVEADTLGEALDILGMDTESATFRANGQNVGLDFAPDEPVTVAVAKNLTGA